MYGGPTPKRHVCWGNSPAVARLDLGTLRGWAKKVREQDAAGVPRVKTTETYVDRQGNKRFKGSADLKASEQETQLSTLSWK